MDNMDKEEKDKEFKESFFGGMQKEDIFKLVSVGFTEDQAIMLLDIMQRKAFSGGMF